MMFTDEQISRLAEALNELPDRIRGFNNLGRQQFYIRDVFLPIDEQVLWHSEIGLSYAEARDEMDRQIRFHRMKLALAKVTA